MRDYLNITTNYIWADGKLLREERSWSGPNHQLGDYLYANTTTIDYTYGVDGVVGFRLNGTPYWYLKNAQGDITHIYDNAKECVAEYKYDAWGNHTVTNHTTANIGTLNALRYRGYHFDVQTNLYYLQSRYYDPEVGRFISPDVIEILDGEIVHIKNAF